MFEKQQCMINKFIEFKSRIFHKRFFNTLTVNLNNINYGKI